MKTKMSNLAFKENVSRQKSREQVKIGRVRPSTSLAVHPKTIIAAIIAVSAMVVVLIFNMVEGSEITAEIYKLKKQYKVQQYEFLKLSNLLEEKRNPSELEKYAKNVLMMKKPSNKQICYFSSSNKNLIEINSRNKCS